MQTLTNKTETLAEKYLTLLQLSFLPLFSVLFFWCGCWVWLLLQLFWLFYQTTLNTVDVNHSMVWMSLLRRDYANFMFVTVLPFLPKHTLLCPPRLATLLPQLEYSLPCQFILALQNTEQNWVDSSQGPALMHLYRSFFFFSRTVFFQYQKRDSEDSKTCFPAWVEANTDQFCVLKLRCESAFCKCNEVLIVHKGYI